jgi:acetyl esterase/lipase
MKIALTRRGVAAGLVLLLTAPALAQSFDLQKGVEYANHDGVSLRGDLYQPKAPGKYPAIVSVHGGGWQGGSPASYAHWGPWLAERGFVVFAVTYRLSKPDQKTYPQAVHDVRAAVQFLRGRGEAVKVDGDRIGMMGGSAGGHLTSLVALAHDEAPFKNAYPNDQFANVSANVKAVVPFYGVFDMQRQWNYDVLNRPHDNITQKFIGVPPTENRKVYLEASPMTYAVRAKNRTSFLIVVGTEDDIVERSQSDDFMLALKQAGFFARRIVVQGAGHFFESDPLDEPFSRPAQAAGPILRFFKERL